MGSFKWQCSDNCRLFFVFVLTLDLFVTLYHIACSVCRGLFQSFGNCQAFWNLAVWGIVKSLKHYEKFQVICQAFAVMSQRWICF